MQGPTSVSAPRQVSPKKYWKSIIYNNHSNFIIQEKTMGGGGVGAILGKVQIPLNFSWFDYMEKKAVYQNTIFSLDILSPYHVYICE
jgi:hypothetical protein